METRYSVKEIAVRILEASTTESREPFDQDPLIQASKRIVAALDKTTKPNFQLQLSLLEDLQQDLITAASYFATDITGEAITYIFCALEELMRVEA